MSHYPRILVAGLLFASVAGCAHQSETSKRAEQGTWIAAEASGPESVAMSKPHVQVERTTISVSGTVEKKKQQGTADPNLNGFADVQVLNDKGELVDEILASLKPTTSPPTGTSTYDVSFWHAKPESARVRVVFIDERDAKRFYAGDAWGSGEAGARPAGTAGAYAPTAPGSATSGNWSRPGGGQTYGGANNNGLGGVGGVYRPTGLTGIGGVRGLR